MAAQINQADWNMMAGRMEAAEQGIVAERAERGRLLAALEARFAEVQAAWARQSALQEELREQLNTLRASFPGGLAGGAGAGLLHPRLLEKPKCFDGDVHQWRDWSDSFRSFLRVSAKPDHPRRMVLIHHLQLSLNLFVKRQYQVF